MGKKRGKASSGSAARLQVEQRLRTRHRWLLVVALMAAGTSAWLVWIHFQLLAAPGAGSACNLGGYLNCDAVNASRFADIGGVPIAYAGFILYLLLAVLAILDLRCVAGRPRSLAYARGLGAVAVAYSLFLAVVSFFVIGALCILCVALYLLNVAIAAIGWYRPPARVRFFATVDRDLKLMVASSAARGAQAAIVAALAGAVAMVWLAAETEASERAPSVTAVRGRNIVAAPGHADGSETAALTVLEFSDFECPYCVRASSTLDSLREEFGDRVRFLFKHFPLHGSCNPATPRGSHANACAAAVAAVCAGEQGQFWEYQRRLFARGVEPRALRAATDGLALDAAVWQQCRWSRRASATVAADVADGIEIGVHTTPTFVIGDRVIVGARPLDELAGFIRAELAAGGR